MKQAVPIRARAFTLVELLVVIAIIALLLSILTPMLTRTVRLSRKVACLTQFHNIGVAFLQFAGQHNGSLPGTYVYPWAGSLDWQKSWMGKEVWAGANYYGTICDYVGGPDLARRLYRCPDLKAGVYNSAVGSNGYFDYSMFLSMSGARAVLIPTTAVYVDLATSGRRQVTTPVLVEEDPAFYLNYVNIEPGHSNVDRMGTWHVGNSGNYLGRDGSGYSLSPSTLGPTSWDWQVVAPSGTLTSMQHISKGYGEWNGR